MKVGHFLFLFACSAYRRLRGYSYTYIYTRLTDNVYAQIGLITLIGLAAKNAILIIEYAKVRVDSGEDLIQSTIKAVKSPIALDLDRRFQWHSFWE